MTQANGGVGSTLEVIDKRKGAHQANYFHGPPPTHQIEYAAQYLAISPRIRSGITRRAGAVDWDYGILDETAMRADPFYADFLPRLGLRYCLAGTIESTEKEYAAVALQRSAKQGRAERNSADAAVGAACPSGL